MSAEWAGEDLDLLPEGTMIILLPARRLWLRLADGWWEIAAGVNSSVSSAEVLDRPGEFRVVSVPVEALLSDKVAQVVADEVGHKYRTTSRLAMRAAIARVTGGSL